MNFQAIFDAMCAEERAKRSESQMTLLEMINALEAMPPGATVQAIGGPHSYRGYYSDLAFEQQDGCRPAADVLKDAKAVLGTTLEGYKGGDFLMGKTTPVWISEWGDSSGTKLIGFGDDGQLITEQEY